MGAAVPGPFPLSGEKRPYMGSSTGWRSAIVTALGPALCTIEIIGSMAVRMRTLTPVPNSRWPTWLVSRVRNT
jgi:hypothetical protein